MNTARFALTRRLRLWAYLAFFVYLAFLGGTVYSDLNFWLRVFHQLVATLFFACWLVILLRRREPWPVSGLELPLAILLAWSFLGCWTSINPRMSVELFWRTVMHVLLFYWLLWVLRRQGWGRWVRAFYLTAGVVCLIGVFEFLGWYAGLPFLPIFQKGWLQISAWANPLPPVWRRLQFTLGSATSLSTFLSLLIPPALALGMRSGRRANRLVWFGWVAVAFLVQLFTQSRGGLLALAVSVPLFVLGVLFLRRKTWAPRWAQWRKRKSFWALALVLIALLVVAGLMVAPSYLRRTSTWDIRVEMWRCALEMIKSRPLLGVGNGVYGEALRSCVSTHSAAYERFTTAHNLYLNLAAESGLPALFALGWLMAALFRLAWLRWQSAKSVAEKLLVLGIGSSLLGYAVNCLVDTLLMTPLVLPVLLLIAWLLAPMDMRQVDSRRPRLVPAVTLCVLLAFLGGLWWLDRAQGHFERSLRAANRVDLAIALDEIEQARQLDPHLGLYEIQQAYYLGVLAAEQPDTYLSDAIASFEAATALDDTYSLHHANLAWLYWQAGRVEAALAAMERATRTNPPSSQYWLNLGLFFEQSGRERQAIDAYAATLAKAPSWAGSDFWQASSFRQENLAVIHEAAIAQGANAFQLWFSAGELEQAKATAQDATGFNHYYFMGRMALAQGNWRDALQALDQVLILNDGHAGAYRDRARAHWELGDVQAAELDAHTALFLDPFGSSSVRQVLAETALAEGELEQAQEHYWRSMSPTIISNNWEVVLYNRRANLRPLPLMVNIAHGPAVFEPWLALADLYQNEGQEDQALHIYELLLARDPYSLETQTRLEKLRQ